ncbi:DinB family protein [Actinomadura litoris]|uniref:DinB family protein n=1 Tax=Actinomadura litoris TaxID=2678616 RepID=UPI001FA742EE|nr:DinB family protein [Actinomadura litoris]
MDDKRIVPPLEGDERSVLAAFLQYHRETLAMKCAGLTPEQLKRRSVPPSSMSLLGLVRHMAEVERIWFRIRLSGEDIPLRWKRRPGDDIDFEVDAADPDEAFAAWNEECARSRDIVAAAESLDVTGRDGDWSFSLRWILAHLIEEYARHNGHADLLRESIDGSTGE